MGGLLLPDFIFSGLLKAVKVVIKNVLLFDLDTDIAEQHDLAGNRPDVVANLMKEVEWARSELGDYNRIGSGTRFFDPGPKRPRTYFPGEPAEMD